MKNGFARRDQEPEGGDNEAGAARGESEGGEQSKNKDQIQCRRYRRARRPGPRGPTRSLGMKTRKERCVAKRRQMNALVAVKGTRGNGASAAVTNVHVGGTQSDNAFAYETARAKGRTMAGIKGKQVACLRT